MNKTLPFPVYFDGTKTHTKNICAHCKFFYAVKVPFKSDKKQGICSHCKECYPELCLCMGENTKPTSNCKNFVLRADFAKIRCEDELPKQCDLENDYIDYKYTV